MQTQIYPIFDHTRGGLWFCFVFSSPGSKLNGQLQQTQVERKHLEKTREELVKKVKGLLEQNKLQRYHGML